MPSYVSADLRRLVESRTNHLCEYCLIHEDDTYLGLNVMPKDPSGDALHLAVSSVHRVDVQLTWNCRHLANPRKMDHIRIVNYELGLPMPLLTTPLNDLSGDESNAE